MEDYGLQGEVVCDTCGVSYKCHLGAWGHPNTKGSCSHCLDGTVRWRHAAWWGEPEHTPPNVIPIGTHLTEEYFND